MSRMAFPLTPENREQLPYAAKTVTALERERTRAMMPKAWNKHFERSVHWSW